MYIHNGSLKVRLHYCDFKHKRTPTNQVFKSNHADTFSWGRLFKAYVDIAGKGLWPIRIHSSKNKTFTQYCFNVGPPSSTLAQHWTSMGSTSRVCWDRIRSKLIGLTRKSPMATIDAQYSISFGSASRIGWIRGFVKLKKNPKSEKNSEVGGWVFPAPTRILMFWGKFCVFCVVFMFTIVSKKKSDRRVDGFCLTNPSFPQIFIFFLTWHDP